MNPSKKNAFLTGTGILSAFCLMVLLMATPAPAHAAVEGLDGVLDGIENAFQSTGLPDARNKLKDEHGLTIKPYFKTRYRLTSNVFLAPDDNSGHTDNIWSFIPGVNILYDMKDWGKAGVSYEAAFNYFTKFYEQNEQDQRFLAFTDLKPSDKTYLRISELLEQEGVTSGASNFKPVNVLDNTVDVISGYVINDATTLQFSYRNFDRSFSNESVERYNYNENRYDYRIIHQLEDNLQVHGGLQIGWVDFRKDHSRDTFYFEFPVGVRTVLPYGIQADAEVGIHRRNLEDSDRNDLFHFVTDISLAKDFNSGKTKVKVGFRRRDYESSFSTATTYDEKLWYASANHLIKDNLRARLQAYVGNRDFEERVFTGARIVVGGVTFVTPADQVKRDDDIFGLTLGFDYRMRQWLVWHLEYSYARRNSNISALDYTENAMTLGSTISL